MIKRSNKSHQLAPLIKILQIGTLKENQASKFCKTKLKMIYYKIYSKLQEGINYNSNRMI